MRAAMFLLITCFVPAFALADEVAPPKGPFPQNVRALLKGDTLYVQQVVWIPQLKAPPTSADGEGPAQPAAPTIEYQGQFLVRPLPLSDVRIFTAAGDRLSEAETRRLFARETDALLNGNSKLIDPRYAELLEPATKIIYFRSQAYATPVTPISPNNAAGQAPFAPRTPPKSPPPTVSFAQLDDDQLHLTTFGWQALPEHQLQERELTTKQGVVQKYTVRESTLHMLPMPMPGEFALDKVNVTGRDGKGKTVASVRQALREPRAVLIHEPDQELDDVHLHAFRDDVLLIEVPQVPRYMQSYPMAIPPRFAWARVDDDQWRLRYASWQAFPKPVIIKQTADGKEVERWETRVEMVPKYFVQEHPLADVKLFSADGEPATAKDAADSFAEETLVLLSADQSPIDPMYLDTVKRDVFTLVAPSLLSDKEPAAAPGDNPGDSSEGIDADVKKGLTHPPPQTAFVRAQGDLLIVRQPKRIRAPVMPAGVDPKTVATPPIRTTVLWDDRVIPLSEAHFTGLDGEPLETSDLADRLAEETVILINENGDKLDDAYLALYEPDTLILQLEPLPTAFAIPAGAPSPAGQGPAPTSRPAK